MGRYSLRKGSLVVPEATIEHLSIKSADTDDGSYTAPYIRFYTPKGASQALAVYLYVGSGGSLRLSSTAPIGNTATAFTNKGKHVASVA
jgi:hypothetical protein